MLYYKNKGVLLLALVQLIPNCTNAQQEIDIYSMTLEDLLNISIHSTSFFHQSAKLSTGSPWVFTQKEMTNSPIVFLKDIFEYYTPGVSAGYSTFSGAALGVRGIAVSDNDKTIFMVNGQNLNQVSLYGYQAGMQSTLLGDIDHIEVVNGPGAILHGSGAINSFINVVTKNGQDNKGFESNLEYGTRDKLQKFELGYGNTFGTNGTIYLYGGVAQADGFLPDSYLEQGESAPLGTDPNRKIYEIPENFRVSAYINHNALEFQTQLQRISRSFNKSASDSLAGVWRGHWQTFWASRLKYKIKLNSNQRLEFSSPLEYYDHGVQLNDREGEKGGREHRTGLKATFFSETTKHKFAMSTAATRNSFDAQKQYFESDKQYLEESLTGELQKYEIVAEDIINIDDDWTLSVGVRYDVINYGTFYEPEADVKIQPSDLSALTKRLASTYQFNEAQTIKAAYQEGFRYPDASYYLTFGVANAALIEADLEPLPDLQEESVKSFEINYLHAFENLSTNLELNLYYNTHKNTLSWVDYSEEMLGTQRYNLARAAIGFGPGAYANSGGTFNAYGSELAISWQSKHNAVLRGSYSFSRPSGVSQNTNEISNLTNPSGKWANYPEHMFKLAVNWSIDDKILLNLTTFYAMQVDICTFDCEPPQTASEKFYNQDRFRINSRINYKLTDKTEISLIAQNVFEDDGPPAGYDTRDGTGSEGGLGDDSRRIYLNLKMKL